MSNVAPNNVKPNFFVLLLLFVSAVLNGCRDVDRNLAILTGDRPAPINQQSRLDIVKGRGKLICGVNGQLPGFSVVDESDRYSGMDVDLCRAIAAALFDDPNRVEYRNLDAQERFDAVSSGEVDILSRNTTWTLSRDTSVGMEFAPTTFYDGQGLLVNKTSGIDRLEDLDNKTVCILSGTTHQQNLEDRLRKSGLSYIPLLFDDVDSLYKEYQEGNCQAVTSDHSQLTSRRALFRQPQEHMVLSEILSKEPLGLLVANDDPQWFDAIKWTIYALIYGEELGVNSQNIASFEPTKDSEISDFLYLEDDLAQNLGLPNDFTKRIIKHVGNYGEIYDRNIGEPFALERGLNALWKDGGLMYAPPFR